MDASSFPPADLFNSAFSPEQNSAERARQLPNHSAALNNPYHKNSALSFSASERFSSAESFSLTLKTREGDNVTINFSNQASFQASIAGSNSSTGRAVGIALETTTSSSFRFSIEGDLNEDEQAAIDNLVKELSIIADKFFTGDVQEAFNSAAELEFDGAQLASFDFKLTQDQSYSRAAAYESVQQLTEPAQALKPLQPVREGLKEQLENADKVIQEASKVTRSLLNNLIEQDNRYTQASEQLQQQLEANLATLDALVNDLGSKTSANNNQQPEYT